MVGKEIIQKIKPFRLYRHSKSGHLYLVLCVARHVANLDAQVIYATLYKNETSKIWVRDLKEFVEVVSVKGKAHPRFVPFSVGSEIKELLKGFFKNGKNFGKNGKA